MATRLTLKLKLKLTEFRQLKSSDQFVQRGIVSISHDMRDNRFLGSAVLEQLKKIETRLMMEQDLEQDDILITGIGGKDGRKIVRSIAKRLISKELGKRFSWFAQKGNRNLSVTNIGKAIMRAAKREKPAISERDVMKKNDRRNNGIGLCYDRADKNSFSFVDYLLGNLSRKLNLNSAMKALIMSQPELASGARVEDAIKNKAQKKYLNMVHTLERKTHNPKKSDGENPGNQTK
ncbi:hypothetical protein DAPPUDRAFT_246866 [Daphnia pulex]|uniref:DUF4806 domain-containing protein n=1 Tax=Daphnia pulex TaxID=6669 RepID=E9GRC3_DAPPU|nr:hypothetical protein DAPPUDRAFT_246866 [Daphnia pulex]|eukprot:EFX77988.1 hypothetical protein DAPPUDRAFT_246866 [Daphnia pulex]